MLIFLPVYIPGWVLEQKARAGAPEAQYQFAVWCENHCEVIGAFILWPCRPDVLGGYTWLEKAAEQDYPPAVYTLGVRLKYGDFVPKPDNWSGPAGNMFPQPARGQPLIDKALALGYKPRTEERMHYMEVYRRGWGR
jgi:TPR repeat protein